MAFSFIYLCNISIVILQILHISQNKYLLFLRKVDRILPVVVGMWHSLVARIVRDDEAAGSNPVIPTIYIDT